MIGAGLTTMLLVVMAAPAPMDCAADLQFAAAFLLKNDAGVQAQGWRQYPEKVAAVLEREKTAATTATSAERCLEVVERFLRSVRKGHLGATLSEGNGSVPGPQIAPVIAARKLSAKSFYIEVPSFGSGVREQLVEVVKTNAKNLRTADHLIIDVRRNPGGSDSAYEPLLEIMGPAAYRSQNAEMLATPANIAAWEAVLASSTQADKAPVERMIARMKAAKSEWVLMSDAPFSSERYGAKRVKATPKSVWVMIGQKCGSSCEEFALAARQNSRVTLVGRRTYGSLDASNLRPVRTPSNRITILYATTYVRRPHGEVIDTVGISPVIELPLPIDDVAFSAEVAVVQRLAEEGRASSSQTNHRKLANPGLQSDGASPRR